MRDKVIAITTTLIFGVLCVSASALTVNDNYYGGDPRRPDGKDFDIYGDEAHYGVSKAELSLNGNILTVDIYSQFFDDLNAGAVGNIALGDLFLSTNGWHPIGSAPYKLDYFGQAGDEQWEYVVVLGDNKATAGTANLYAVEVGRILTADELPPGEIPSQYIRSQEVRYNAMELTSGAIGSSWGIQNLGGDDTDDYLRFEINISTIANFDFNNLGFRWTMTCANDIIEGGTNPVPEPMSLLLFGTGFIGLAGNSLRKRWRR